MSIFMHQDYSDYLKEVLLEKTQKNPSFSLRAFAKQLGLRAPFLSEILSSKRQLSDDAAHSIVEKLLSTDEEKKYFHLLVRFKKAKKPENKALLLHEMNLMKPKQSKFNDLGVDHFLLISDWYHFAILRLLDMEDFVFNSKNIAQALGIKTLEVESALKRMERLELIEKNAEGRLQKVKDNLLVTSKHKNEALHKYHTQMLEKQIAALSTQNPQIRYGGTENIVLDEKGMKKARELYEECLNKIVKISNETKTNADVFHVGIHMIKLTDLKNSERRKT